MTGSRVCLTWQSRGIPQRNDKYSLFAVESLFSVVSSYLDEGFPSLLTEPGIKVDFPGTSDKVYCCSLCLKALEYNGLGETLIIIVG